LLIIDDTRKCPVCGAYPDGRGYCSNGHLQRDEYILTPQELRAITEQERERQWVRCTMAVENVKRLNDITLVMQAVVNSYIDKET